MKFNIYLKKVFAIFLSFAILEITTLKYNLIAKEDSIEALDGSYLKQLPENDYLLGPGDEFFVIVNRDIEELTTKVSINGEGTINLPKIKTVYVEGLTVNELKKILNQVFKEFVKYPAVEINFIKYRPIRVMVEGEVLEPGLKALPGSYSLENLTETGNNILPMFFYPTVFDAIRSSNGITEYSNLSEIEIFRKNNLSKGGGRIKATINLEDLIQNGDASQNIRIYSSDVIKVKKLKNPRNNQLSKAIQSKLNRKFIEVNVIGRVNNPGRIKLTKASTLNDAIDVAGGLQVLNGPIRFLRFNNDGTIDKRKFGYKRKYKRGSYKNPFLKENDLIFIDKNAFTVTNEILTEVVKPFNGLLSMYGLVKILQD